VIVEYESVLSKQSDEDAAGAGEKAVDAFFTFVSIDNSGKAIHVPSLVVNNASCCFILCADIMFRHICRKTQSWYNLSFGLQVIHVSPPEI